jgi:TrmH family RNA methyltransferase
MTWSIILVSPKGERNLGGVARVMGNFGFEDLRIVAPRCEVRGLECKKMAMTSFDIIEKAQIFDTFAEAQADRTYTIALSGRRAEDDRPRVDLFKFIEDVPSLLHVDDRVALVFGREEWGLRLEELDRCNAVVEIPTRGERKSINLTSAAAITLSLFFNRCSAIENPASRREFIRPDKPNVDLFFERIYKILDRVKFINPQNPSHHLEDLRAMFNRSDLSERDLRILFGILSGVESQLFPACSEIWNRESL